MRRCLSMFRSNILPTASESKSKPSKQIAAYCFVLSTKLLRNVRKYRCIRRHIPYRVLVNLLIESSIRSFGKECDLCRFSFVVMPSEDRYIAGASLRDLPVTSLLYLSLM
jgi:hypothetical protein